VILVDTAVWIDWLRGRETRATTLLEALLDEGEALLAPVILQEILQGARSPAALETLREHFSHLPLLDPSLSVYLGAGALYARCRWQGITPRSPHDCLIAQHALDAGVPLLQVDRDFGFLARVEPALRLLP